ncbi:DUF397 domain-containing protein [Streptosporangium sp. H16]|uniref:DUF397 domain-containing protein n=1 Tax=Streptosporangium sp. H16 TaxID=3444184 RepID=UPI003F7AE576
MEAADLTGFDLSEAIWKKSSLSGGSGGNCVEVAGNLPGAVAVRDSKDPAGPALVLTSGEWRSFLTVVKSGHFD